MKYGEFSLTKLARLFVFACSFSLVAACGGGGGGTVTVTAIGGTWTITETAKTDGCNVPSEPLDPPTIVQITQSGNNISLVDDDGETFTGTISGTSLSVSATLTDAGNTIAATLNATISGDTMAGTVTLVVTGPGVPGGTCTITINFTGVKGSNIASYLPVGPQVNVPEATVTGGGWSACHTDGYDASTAILADVLAACNKPRLMLACRMVGDPNYTLLAQAGRAHVTFDTMGNPDRTTVHNENGTDWYFNPSHSWGFALEGDAVNKNSCDTNMTGANDQRLCWHTNSGNLDSGWRCGTTASLRSAAWERQVLHAD